MAVTRQLLDVRARVATLIGQFRQVRFALSSLQLTSISHHQQLNTIDVYVSSLNQMVTLTVLVSLW
jgi:hypothetical protein